MYFNIQIVIDVEKIQYLSLLMHIYLFSWYFLSLQRIFQPKLDE